MITPASTIMRASTRDPDGPFNIMLFPHMLEFHEVMGRTLNNFYVLRHPQFDWPFSEGKPPANHVLLPPNNELKIMPLICDIDFIISQTRNTDEFQICYQIAQFYHLPILAIESMEKRKDLYTSSIMRGNLNVFTSEPIRASWEIFDERNSILLQKDEQTPAAWHKLFAKAAKSIFKGNNKI